MAKTVANGQLRMAVQPKVEKTNRVLLFDGGCNENACTRVAPYIAKLEGRKATQVR